MTHARAAAEFKLLDQAPFVDGFDEPRSFVSMHLNGCRDNGLGQARSFLEQRMHQP